MTISPICRIRPNSDDNPPRPPNIPPPNSMPNRPAPRKPAARPRSMPPGRLKKPPPAVVAALPGWAMVRLNGCAADGAVDVLGGAENVRAPREPELTPPPTRASAEVAATTNGQASDKTTAKACTKPKTRGLKFMTMFLKNPRSHGLDALRKAPPLGGQGRSKGKPQRGGWAAAL